MPVFFYIDPEFATDPRLKGVDNLTLSYTFFKVTGCVHGTFHMLHSKQLLAL